MPFGGNSPFDDIDDLLNRLQGELERATHGIEGPPALSGPAVDVADRDDDYVVTVDLPGFDREAIDVSIVDQSLRISAERESSTDSEDESEGRTFIRQERSRQSTSRTIRLPGPVDGESVSATYTNGVLRVTLPKASGDEGHRIEIE
ncbi:MAG: Hsp20/alpha crystallin family protein [Halobacteriales archaeon]|nr:Hsp20/alpha crystallin family protein [Halobacteriales archaeon]